MKAYSRCFPASLTPRKLLALVLIGLVTVSLIVALSPSAPPTNIQDYGGYLKPWANVRNYSYNDSPSTINGLSIATPFYVVGLRSGFIFSYALNGHNLLASPFGLSMNEVAGPYYYFLQSNGNAHYLVSKGDSAVRVMCTQSNCGAGVYDYTPVWYNNTFIFRNDTSIIEVYTTRIINLTVSSYAHQICFVFNSGAYFPTAYFDANRVVNASLGINILDSMNSSYAGYIIGNITFTIKLLDHDASAGFYDSSIGFTNSYNEIQITWFRSGDSGPHVGGGYYVEYAHYLMQFTEA